MSVTYSPMIDCRKWTPADAVAMVTKHPESPTRRPMLQRQEKFYIKSANSSREVLYFSNKHSKQLQHDECSVTEAETDFSGSFNFSLDDIHRVGNDDDDWLFDENDEEGQSSSSCIEDIDLIRGTATSICDEQHDDVGPSQSNSSSDDHDPSQNNAGHAKYRKSTNSRRLTRMNSIRLEPSLNAYEETRDNEESDAYTEPMDFSELLEMDTTTGRKQQLRSCLKQSNDQTEQMPKFVCFATNTTGRAWCLPRIFERVPENNKHLVWWTFEELEEFYEEQYFGEINDELEEDFGYLISDAFDSVRCPKEESALINFASFFRCSDLRGLEKRVFDVHHFVNKHRDAVLAAQAEINGSEEGPAEDQFHIDPDLKLEILSLRSIKYSHPARLVALKLAECDASALRAHEEHEDEMGYLDDRTCASSVCSFDDIVFGAHADAGHSIEGAASLAVARRLSLNMDNGGLLKLFEQHKNEMRALKDDSSCVSSLDSDEEHNVFGAVNPPSQSIATVTDKLLGKCEDSSSNLDENLYVWG